MDVDQNKFIYKELRAVFKDTGLLDPASILLNLTDYRVITVTQAPSGRRHVLVEPMAAERACPTGSLLTTRIQARPIHQVKDVSVDGTVLQVLVRKCRLTCPETDCSRLSFVQTTVQSPFRARITTCSPKNAWIRWAASCMRFLRSQRITGFLSLPSCPD